MGKFMTESHNPFNENCGTKRTEYKKHSTALTLSVTNHIPSVPVCSCAKPVYDI